MDPTKLINLIPGNWFELKILNKNKTSIYDINRFKNEIINQIADISEKLSIINIKFSKTYKKTDIQDIEFYITDEMFAKINSMLENNNEKRHPLLTFHGTTRYEVVESIISNGYMIPNDPDSEIKITTAHGAIYGPGVYTTPHIDKALSYTRLNTNGSHVYLIVNFLLLGNAKIISSCLGIDHSFPKKKIFDDGSIDYYYSDNTNTRIVNGMEQIISANKYRVFPVATIRIQTG
jgi:hypothetical protein